MLNRREAFGGLMFVAAGAAALTPAHAVAQGALAPLGWTPAALTPVQAMTLDAASEAIMPATDTPGAKEAGVARSIDAWVGNYCVAADAAAIRGALDRLDADARAAGAASFAAAAPAQQAAVLTRIDAEPAPATGRAPFAVLKEYVTVAFFTSRPGATRTLRYDPNPGPYRGCIPVSQVGRAWATS
ncbi:gluconate 2-dehydrogenase subunit 3 family protein [Phenylobacterium sp.]|uniref:gluconate 2-dehydrogenase subunit 3 family protein n=1 Tax=Phenylobacterium sp. TaxID=1871053 RepID=UPI0025E3AAF7|nr:gluconate 2-dehydrogenase subunit 3 family protein [Phenylobacterium sp.]